MPKQQSDFVPAVEPVAAPAGPAEPQVGYVDLVCPHDGRTYPCYDWCVDSLVAQGWEKPKS